MTRKVPVPVDFDALGFRSLDVLSLAGELLTSENAAGDGRTSRTLARSRGLTLVLTAIRAGHSLHDHAAPGPLTIVPIVGTSEFGSDSAGTEEVGPGRVLMIGAGETHRVRAREDCAFLILIGAQA
jgi:quercetin dioxygenase-like cupin family protein